MHLSRSLLLTLAAGCLAGAASAQSTRMASVNSLGDPGDDHSAGAAVSADGRYVAYYSEATNLMPGDFNLLHDVFVHDLATGTTACVSLTPAGAVGNGGSFQPALSPDGRFVSFDGFATDLVPGDVNNQSDVFLHDAQTGLTEMISVSSAGAQGDGHSQWSAVSGDGRYVVFDSFARNLVAGDTNGTSDIFLRDRTTGTTLRLSISAGGVQGNGPSQRPSITPDGRFVVFDSLASNLVSNDSNGRGDVFVYDRLSGSMQRVSVNDLGSAGNADSFLGSISDDGAIVGFSSGASNLVGGDGNGALDVFVRDRVQQITTRVSLNSQGTQGNAASTDPAVSADGQFVTFFSLATNLVVPDLNPEADVFVHDRVSGATTLVSINTFGTQADGGCELPAISSDGRVIAFNSHATNLAGQDLNADHDVFVRERWAPDLLLTQSNLQRGQTAYFEVLYAPTREPVVLLLSTTGVGAGPCHPTGGFCLDLLDPVFVIGRALSNATGTTFRVDVPPTAPLIQVHTQAVALLGPNSQDSRLTNVVSAPILP